MSEILLVLRKPLHKILGAQKITNNVPLEERLALKEYQQDLELPVSSHAQQLNELFIDETLSAAEVVYGIDFKVIDLPETYQKQSTIALFREEEFIEQNIAGTHTILETLHDMSIGFKALDVAINSIRFAQEPTASNARKVIIESAHLYTMFSDFNWYSNVVNMADIIYSGYLGEYNKVLQYALVTVTYMGLPYAAACFGASQIVLIYNIFVASYSAYSALSNLYSLYEEYLRDDWALKSDAAYAELGWFLHSAFGHFSYDFFAKSNGNDEEMCLVDYMGFSVEDFYQQEVE